MNIDKLAEMSSVDELAFEKLINQIKPYIIKNVNNNVECQDDFDELEQLIMIGIWEVVKIYNPKYHFWSILKTKARRVIWRWKNKKTEDNQYLSEDLVVIDFNYDETYLNLTKILDDVTARVVYMRYGLGMKPKDIADELGLSPKYISHLAIKGLKILKSDKEFIKYLFGLE